MMLSDLHGDNHIIKLSDVCRVHPVGGRRVRPAGCMARIGWSGPARPAWLKAAVARFRCRPGRGGQIVAAARLQLVILPFLRITALLLARSCPAIVSIHLPSRSFRDADERHRSTPVPDRT